MSQNKKLCPNISILRLERNSSRSVFDLVVVVVVVVVVMVSCEYIQLVLCCVLS